MATPIREWTEAQRARRARKLARRREAGHEPRPVDADKLATERARLKRLADRRPKASRRKLTDRYGPEAAAAYLRALGFVQGGAPLAKHRRRKATRAARRASRT